MMIALRATQTEAELFDPALSAMMRCRQYICEHVEPEAEGDLGW